MRDAPTQRKPKNRRATFRFPMPSVRASIPSAVANGFANPRMQCQRQSILATRSSVMFDRRLACWESRSAAGTTSGTRGTTLRKQLGEGELTASEAQALKSAYPADLVAERLYAEGLAELRLLNAIAARPLLEKAVEMQPSVRAYQALGEIYAHAQQTDHDANSGHREQDRPEYQRQELVTAGWRVFRNGHRRRPRDEVRLLDVRQVLPEQVGQLGGRLEASRRLLRQ